MEQKKVTRDFKVLTEKISPDNVAVMAYKCLIPMTQNCFAKPHGKIIYWFILLKFRGGIDKTKKLWYNLNKKETL